MKISEFNLSRRARSGQTAIKFIKANPHYIVDAKKLSSTQYRENVKANLVYTNGNQYEETYQFKYNLSDAGKAIDKNKELAEPYMLFIDPAQGKEPIIPGDYLVEVKPQQTSIFDSSIENTTFEDISTESILSDLDKILEEEALKEEIKNEEVISNELPKTIIVKRDKPGVVEKKKEELPNTIIFKKVNLFGEEF
jgi:hypothetical protein